MKDNLQEGVKVAEGVLLAAFELQMIEEGIKCDEEVQKFRVSYPFIEDPYKLSNNPGQAIKIAESEEKKLWADGYMEEFN